MTHTYPKPVFLLVFTAALVSGLGDGLIPIAFALQAHRVDPSGRGLTAVLIALWAGRFLSSLAVRKLPSPSRPAVWMIGSDLMRMAAQWGLVAWIATHGDSITAFAVSSLVYGCASSFFAPARFGLLSLLFSDQHRTRVNGILSMLGDVLFVAGPLIGTAAVLTLGFRTVLLIDGTTFLAAALLVLPFLPLRSTTTAGMQQSTSVSASASPAILPSWVQVGLGTWLIVAVVNGFLGSAGPTWIMETFGEKSWGVMAAALAVGSLLGSGATILKALDRFRFSTLQTGMLVLLAGQLLALAFSPAFVLIALVGAAASMLMTAAGISWDSLGQSLGGENLVHQFASKDQLVFTAGTPLGMVLFAALAETLPRGGALALVALMLLAAGIECLPMARSPRAADLTSAPNASG